MLKSKVDKLWAPWREEYIVNIHNKKKKGCIFCKIADEKKDRKNHIFVRSQHCYAVLNIYPYNNGHTLVLPYRHCKDLGSLRENELVDLMELLNYTQKLLGGVLKPDGYNIGMNVGKVAGAGVPGHAHFHVVPRWNGDVNFMPVLAETKVMSQSLKVLYDRLLKTHKRGITVK